MKIKKFLAAVAVTGLITLSACDSKEKSIQELIIGAWENSSLDQLNSGFAEGLKLEQQTVKYNKDGKGQIILNYLEPTQAEQNPMNIDFEYELVTDKKEIKYTYSDNAEEFEKIIELTDSKLIVQLLTVNEDGTRQNADLPQVEFTREK